MDKLLGPTTSTTKREDHQSWLSKYFAKVHEKWVMQKLIQLDQLHLVQAQKNAIIESSLK